ncbi:polyprotein (retrotransposon protein) [Pyrus ussuriensis x Pyrus communis]|uniref:Polyprotein (Retrotransposon protein) n=1 Tax=Pyrus ussuriensis x Pyrus communis TaxID=2448454 RepID=A0A5N5HC33_9ROSA|nr:polyprotein (retrotransposon protein) [Pyrus ussuriensis x Pyrus communis]
MAQGPEEPTVNPTIAYLFYPTHEKILDYGTILEETNPPLENHEISVYYASLDDVWRRNQMIVHDALAFAIATEIMLSDDIEQRSVDESIQVELDSLAKRKVFGPITHTPPHVKPNEIVRYKAHLFAQGFSQCPGIDYDETYSPVMDGYVNNELCPCVFIKKSHFLFAIVAVYVDDMNLIGTPEELVKIATHLKSEFEMKDLAVVDHIRSSCDLYPAVNAPTTIFEDNATCIEQLKKGYIKGDSTKHIVPKFFFTHQQQNHQKIKVTQIRSQDNLANLFTKSLPNTTFQKLVQGIDVGHIRSSCDLYPVIDVLTTIYEDNVACIKQLNKGYIKGDNTKHIAPKFLFSHQQQEYQKIEVMQIRSQDNLANIFTKLLPKATFQKLVQGIGMRKLSESFILTSNNNIRTLKSSKSIPKTTWPISFPSRCPSLLFRSSLKESVCINYLS